MGRALRLPMSHLNRGQFGGGAFTPRASGNQTQQVRRPQAAGATGPPAKKPKPTVAGGSGATTGAKGGPKQDLAVQNKESGSVTFSGSGVPRYWCPGHKKRTRHHPSLCLMVEANQQLGKEELDLRQQAIDEQAKKTHNK